MPRKTWDTKADFDGAYSLRIARYRDRYPGISADEPSGNYDRRTLFNSTSSYPPGGAIIEELDYVTPEWDRIIAHYNWPLTTSICIVGTGYGWAIEYLNSRGYMDVWGSDNSTYIQNTKNDIDVDGVKRSLVAVRVHNSNLVVPGEVRQFLQDSGHRNGPGGETPFDVCVTERVLSSLEDSEAVFLSGQIRTMNIITPTGTVIHLEEPPPRFGLPDPSFNFHTKEEWKALLPNDDIVFRFGKEFL